MSATRRAAFRRLCRVEAVLRPAAPPPPGEPPLPHTDAFRAWRQQAEAYLAAHWGIAQADVRRTWYALQTFSNAQGTPIGWDLSPLWVAQVNDVEAWPTLSDAERLQRVWSAASALHLIEAQAIADALLRADEPVTPAEVTALLPAADRVHQHWTYTLIEYLRNLIPACVQWYPCENARMHAGWNGSPPHPCLNCRWSLVLPDGAEEVTR